MLLAASAWITLACGTPGPVLTGLVADAETAPVASPGDAADDPAIWINADDPGRSLILGTEKQAALHLYDLRGELVQTVAGAVNNVDVRQARFGDRNFDVAAASLSQVHGFVLWTLGADGKLTEQLRNELPRRGDHTYGLCLGVLGGELYVFITDHQGAIEQWRVERRGDSFRATLAAAFALPTRTEGCVVDDTLGAVYFAEETQGVWRFPADPFVSGEGRLIAAVGSDQLAADVEGLALYDQGGGRGYLIVSSQGNHRLGIYRRESPHAFVASLQVGEGRIDAVTETDGIEVTAAALGSAYPRGLLVVHDGSNTSPIAGQNFKIIDWRRVERAIADQIPP